jgi:lipopolysaccharide export system protein LptA
VPSAKHLSPESFADNGMAAKFIYTCAEQIYGLRGNLYLHIV